MKHRLNCRNFAVLPYPEEAELARSRVAEIAWKVQDEENGFNGGRWV